MRSSGRGFHLLEGMGACFFFFSSKTKGSSPELDEFPDTINIFTVNYNVNRAGHSPTLQAPQHQLETKSLTSWFTLFAETALSLNTTSL